MKRLLLLLLCIAVLNTSAETNEINSALSSITKTKDINPEKAEYLRNVLHYIYTWHLNENYFFENDEDKTVEIFVKEKKYPDDIGNNSIKYELIIPDLNLGLSLMRANYRIEELGLLITNDSFKIVTVKTDLREPGTNDEYIVKILKEKKLFLELFKKRNRQSPPSEFVKSMLKKSLKKIARMELKKDVDKPQLFYIGPLSKYSNDIWIFWETGRKLIRFSSAADYTTKAYWQLLPMFTEIFDLDTDVVTSLQEVSGSNAYITKSFSGMILYNCIIDGTRIIIPDVKSND